MTSAIRVLLCSWCDRVASWAMTENADDARPWYDFACHAHKAEYADGYSTTTRI